MYSEVFYPMAPRNSVPRICRHYHHQHLPPPEEPTKFMAELRRGLRGVDKGTLWGKVKSAGWRLLLKIDNYVFEEEPPLHPNFPVAAPPSPRPHVRKISPDIHITPAGRPDYILSPPPPQEDGFLFVPVRSSRAGRQRRQERLPPSPRPLPTPPGPPSCPIPNISCCPWANNPSTQPPPTTPLTGSEAEDAAIRFFILSAPYLLSTINENSSEGDNESPGPDTSDTSTDAAGSDQVRRPKDAMTLDETQAKEIRDVAGDEEFLEDIGLSLQVFIALLDGVDIQWSDD